MRQPKRDQLIAAASDLFNRHGYHAAGIDRVIEESGIAKTTLYRHFKSKDDLIVAVLEKADEKFRDAMRAHVDASAYSDDEKLLATFDYLEEWFASDDFCGCPFISAASEFGEKPNAILQSATMHKRLVVAYFEELARLGHFARPRLLAEQINLLHEGATAVAHINRQPGIALNAGAIARSLLAAADKLA